MINTHDGLPFGPHEYDLLRAFRPFVVMAILQRDESFERLLETGNPPDIGTLTLTDIGTLTLHVIGNLNPT